MRCRRRRRRHHCRLHRCQSSAASSVVVRERQALLIHNFVKLTCATVSALMTSVVTRSPRLHRRQLWRQLCRLVAGGTVAAIRAGGVPTHRVDGADRVVRPGGHAFVYIYGLEIRNL